MAELYRKLEQYRDSDYYPFHMPGHKRNQDAAEGVLAECYGIDITEIDGFDNLHQAEGLLAEEQEKAAGLYGAEKSYYLVNGSTCGILSSVFAVTEQGGRILMARNCHRAVYHGVYLRQLEAVYLQPEIPESRGMGGLGIAGEVSPAAVEKALRENPGCMAVIITSPTYEGVLSDVGKIADIAHSYGIPLVVDEAHGAHLGFHEAFPAGAVQLGADLVIHSVHKTLPAMTQAGLLHWMGNRKTKGREEGGFADRSRLERYLRIFQTSSPSYVLMSSISNCMEIMKQEGRERLDRLLKHRSVFLKRLENCRYVKIWPEKQDKSGSDPCKLVISVVGDRITGQELYDILLEKYHLQMEMAAANYVLAIFTIMDVSEGWNRLADALEEIDCGLERKGAAGGEKNRESLHVREPAKKGKASREQEKPMLRIAEAYDAKQESVALAGSAGRTAAEFINLYPPGIPLLVPGERFTEEITERLLTYQKLGLKIQGVNDGLVRVVKE